MPPDVIEPKPCLECTGLRKGTRSSQKPHQYLVLVRRSEPGTPACYKCLLCNTELTRHDDGLVIIWK